MERPAAMVNGVEYGKDGRDSRGFTRLHWATQMDVDHVLEILQESPELTNDINNDSRQSPLIWAALKGDAQIAALLLDYDAEIDISDVFGFTAATYAARSGNGLLLFILIKMGAELSIVDSQGHSILHWAAYEGHGAVLSMLVRRKPTMIDNRDDKGASPLHYAAVRQLSTTSIRVLLEAGADPYLKDHEGNDVFGILDKWPAGLKVLQQHGLETSWNLNFFGTIALFILTVYLSSYSLYFYLLPILLLGGVKYFSPKADLYFKGTVKVPSPAPFGYMFTSGLVTWYFHYAYLVDMPYTMLHIFWNISMALMYFLVYKTRSDPGVLPQFATSISPSTTLFCSICENAPSLRSRHCTQYHNACVERFDHVCGLTDCVIGKKNHGYFMALVSCVWINHVIWYTESIILFNGQTSWLEWASQHPAFTAFFCWQILQIFSETLLFVVQWRNVFTNRTMLQHGENSFDLGLVDNVKQFFFDFGPEDEPEKMKRRASTNNIA